jgi:hypothetical protein
MEYIITNMTTDLGQEEIATLLRKFRDADWVFRCRCFLELQKILLEPDIGELF